MPEAKDKLLDIFNRVYELYKKDSALSFFFRDLMVALSRIHANEIKEVVFTLSKI